MKLTHNTQTKLKPGMTLIELTVVIIVLLTLISVLFFAGTAYIKASNRTACMANQANIQKAIRGWASLKQVEAGEPIDWDANPDSIITGGYFAALPSTMFCPSGDVTDSAYADTADILPVGTLMAPCTNNDYAPQDVTGPGNEGAITADAETGAHIAKSINNW